MKKVFISLIAVLATTSAGAAGEKNLSVVVTPNVQTVTTNATEENGVTGVSMLADLLIDRRDVKTAQEVRNIAGSNYMIIVKTVVDEPNLRLAVEKHLGRPFYTTLVVETGAPLNQVKIETASSKKVVRITGRIAERLFNILKEGGAKLNSFGHYSVQGFDAIYGQHQKASDIACGPDFHKVKKIHCVVH